jgi:AhpD family alkylhydroperoxidase
MTEKLPTAYERFKDDFPEVWAAYDALGAAAHAAGPLDATNRQLVKLALAVAARSEGATHAHTRKCLEAGISAEAIRQVVLLAIPTIGYPAAMAAMTWVDDILHG